MEDENSMEDDLQWKTTLRTTSKTKRTYTLLEGTWRWTYSALRYFFDILFEKTASNWILKVAEIAKVRFGKT